MFDRIRFALKDGKLNEAASKWLTTLFVLAGIWWGWFAFFYAPSHVDPAGPPPAISDRPDRIAPELAVRTALAESLADVAPRFEFLRGSNLDVYVRRNTIDEVPFPDRAETVRHVGSAWCKNVEHFFLPSVRIRDIRTGDILGSFSCLTGGTDVPERR